MKYFIFHTIHYYSFSTMIIYWTPSQVDPHDSLVLPSLVLSVMMCHPTVLLDCGLGARSCSTIGFMAQGHPLCFVRWSHCKIRGLIFCVWEFWKQIVVWQKVFFWGKCKVALLDWQVTPLLEFYLQNNLEQEGNVFCCQCRSHVTEFV